HASSGWTVDGRLRGVDRCDRNLLSRAAWALGRFASDLLPGARKGWRGAILVTPAWLGWARARAGGSADGLHDAHHDRRRLGPAPMGAAARALSADVRHRVPRASAHPDAGPPRLASRRGDRRPATALANAP